MKIIRFERDGVVGNIVLANPLSLSETQSA
jgi:hypothetical protein